MKDFFKPEDFKPILDLFDMGNLSKTPEAQAAKLANEKLNKLIQSSPVVFCSKPDGNSELWTHNECKGHDTHKAILFNIEEIKKECVKHEPTTVYSEGTDEPKYIHSFFKLVAEWKVNGGENE